MSRVAMPKFATIGGSKTPIPVRIPQMVIWRLRYLVSGLTIKPSSHLGPEDESSSSVLAAFFLVFSSSALKVEMWVRCWLGQNSIYIIHVMKSAMQVS